MTLRSRLDRLEQSAATRVHRLPPMSMEERKRRILAIWRQYEADRRISAEASNISRLEAMPADELVEMFRQAREQQKRGER